MNTTADLTASMSVIVFFAIMFLCVYGETATVVWLSHQYQSLMASVGPLDKIASMIQKK